MIRASPSSVFSPALWLCLGVCKGSGPRSVRRIAIAIHIAASVPGAEARWSPGATLNLGMGMAQIALGQSVLSGTRAAGGAGSGRAPGELTPHLQKYASFRVRPIAFQKDSRSRYSRRIVPMSRRGKRSGAADMAGIKTRLARRKKRLRSNCMVSVLC